MSAFRRTVAGLVALSLAPFPVAALAQATQAPPDWAYRGPWHMMGWGGGGFWWIFPLFMCLMIVVCVVLMMRGPWGHGHRMHNDPTADAMRILHERFARGEIEAKEYEERKAAIRR